MSGCCGPARENPDHGLSERYRSVFTARFSRSIAKRYEKKGLRPIERRIVDFLAGTGLEGASVLEIGGGAGEVQLELLARGAARSTNLELSDAYEPDAARLLARAGLTDRVTRRLGVDLARTPDAVEPADVVVLHRVVCCYPDYSALLSAAAGHAGRALAFSYPTTSLLNRLAVAGGNLLLSATGRSFRTFVHPVEAMVEVVRAAGLEPVYGFEGFAWQITGAVRHP